MLPPWEPTPASPSRENWIAKWRCIYDQIMTMLPCVEELALDRPGGGEQDTVRLVGSLRQHPTCMLPYLHAFYDFYLWVEASRTAR